MNIRKMNINRYDRFEAKLTAKVAQLQPKNRELALTWLFVISSMVMIPVSFLLGLSEVMDLASIPPVVSIPVFLICFTGGLAGCTASIHAYDATKGNDEKNR